MQAPAHVQTRHMVGEQQNGSRMRHAPVTMRLQAGSSATQRTPPRCPKNASWRARPEKQRCARILRP